MRKLIKSLLAPFIHPITNHFLFAYIAREAGYTKIPFAPPGHFYSPIPYLKDIEARESQIFGRDGRDIKGVDLREAQQIELIQALSVYYDEIPFTSAKQDGLRYYFQNHFFSSSDGIFLHLMMRHFRPKTIIEAGSGFSSCVMLDTNDLFFDGGIHLEFIEPHPERLYDNLSSSDKAKIVCHEKKLQDIPLDVFEKLEAGDVLFIDSSHVTRIGGEVNHYLFEILPILKPGVLVHIHDIFNAFEYPKYWVYEGRCWSEAYLVRAFLQYNQAFEILLFGSFLEHFHEPLLKERMPLCLAHPGQSIWLRKTTG